MVHFYIGDGKGKTTASVGLAVRAAGMGKKVYIAQFLKDCDFASGEIEAIQKANINIKIERLKGQMHPMLCKGKDVDEEKIAKLVQGSLEDILALIKEKQYDLVILDELLNALSADFCSIGQVQSLIQEAKDIELVLTGRSVPDDLVEYADYISNVTKIKHPFDRKIVARKGIEY